MNGYKRVLTTEEVFVEVKHKDNKAHIIFGPRNGLKHNGHVIFTSSTAGYTQLDDFRQAIGVEGCVVDTTFVFADTKLKF